LDTALFVNYYEVFDVDPNAPARVIERRFRQLVRTYHPDNGATGDRAMFDSIVEAHETLKDPDKRARYHEKFEHQLPPLQPEAETTGAAELEDGEDGAHQEAVLDEIGIDRDLSIQNNILALLYHRRRLHMDEPGIGNAELQRLTGCAHEHMEFHLWYLREKGWIATSEQGLLAITIDGVDRAAALHREGQAKRITDQS